MSKKTDAMKRKAKKNLAKAKVKLAKFKTQATVEIKRHARAFKLAAKRYKTALRTS
jgi:hypothetical protein